MRSEWKQAGYKNTTLGAICISQGGAINTGPFGSQLHTSDYKEQGVPVVMPTNIGEGGIIVDQIARIGDDDVKRLRQHRLCVGDIIFSRRGDVTKNALVRSHEAGWLCGTGCLKVSLGTQARADARFISYYLRLPEIKNWLIRHAVGATMPNLNTGILSAVPIMLPAIHEQLIIAEILGALDDRITLLRETNTTLEAIAQALFKSWFVDFDPVRAKQEGREPEGMDSDTAVLFPDSFEESELGLVPKGWVVKSLGKKFVPTKGRNITKLTVTTGEVPVVAGGLSPAYYHNECNVDGPVTTISASGANAGYVKLYHENIWASDCSYVSKRHTNHVYSMYLFLKSRQSEITYMQQGAAQPHVYPKDLMRLLIADAPVALWDNFESLVSPFFEQIRVSLVEASCLSDLRDTLLPRLISGQLRLPEAQALTEEATE